MLKGGWWWKSCGRGLNGIYLTDPQDLTARQGIYFIRNISKRVKFDLFFILKISRNCLVPLARMGLYTKAGYDDDPPATLRQGALDTKSLKIKNP